MISDIKQAIVSVLNTLYPSNIIYDENIPQDFEKPSFIIYLINQVYSKRMNIKFNCLLSFDIAYFSNEVEVKNDCLNVQLNLFRAFDLIGNYRVLNKKATISDNVLHFTFDIRYSEINQEEFVKMQQQQLITRTEE